MKKNYFLLFTILIFNSNLIFSQGLYDIKIPNLDREQKCQRCTSTFQQKPKEVNFSIQKDKSNNLFFVINDKNWFNQLFKNEGDGIAIDIVSKDRYDCTIKEIEQVQIKGKLLKPIYSKQLKSGLKPFEQERFRVNVGKLPTGYENKELEFNILFLSDRNLCRYQTISHLESYSWDLLDMGMYLDSLTFKTKLSTTHDKNGYTLKYKTLKFTIPFEKNKSVYSQEDIKPLYDSLRLTDYNIKKINIIAYSSVEGNLERNIELQEQRANSIVKALQTFQKPTIVTEVFSSENWVEFLNDISNTNYDYLKDLSKTEIKSKLTGETVNELETYLQDHRKAVITLQLEKKDRYKNLSANALLDMFNNTAADGKIEEASEIQNSIFEKLKNKEISPEFLNKMIIPQQVKYATILNKNASIKYLMEEAYLLKAYYELEKLQKMVPRNGKVRYNLAVLKFKIWEYNAQPVDDLKFKKEILYLSNYGISDILIERMLVNYHIVKSEKYMQKRDYVNKDKSVAYIYKNYKNIPLSDSDYLSLAQYLSRYSNYDMAVEILNDKVKSIEVDEDLLYYYLNLTIIDNELTQTTDYRTIMLNAINMDKNRFCKLFDPFGDGGATFQLLDNMYLRKTYCENCTQN